MENMTQALPPQVRKALDAWPTIEPIVYVPRNESEYQRLVRLLDPLINEVEEDESHPLASLMDLIGTLVEKYENEHVPVLK